MSFTKNCNKTEVFYYFTRLAVVFRCNATLECVEQRLNCDGNEDCADGSDEWNCGMLVLLNVIKIHN